MTQLSGNPLDYSVQKRVAQLVVNPPTLSIDLPGITTDCHDTDMPEPIGDCAE